MKAMDNLANAVGESFHVVSPGALTLLGYAESVAGWYGKEARIRFLPREEWRITVSEKETRTTWDHIPRFPNCSLAKAQRLVRAVLDAARHILSGWRTAPARRAHT